jgi:hypothetical protein
LQTASPRVITIECILETLIVSIKRVTNPPSRPTPLRSSQPLRRVEIDQPISCRPPTMISTIARELAEPDIGRQLDRNDGRA